MNGGFPRAYFTLGEPAAMRPGAHWKRLSVALMVSGLLHAALLLMPDDLGTSPGVSSPAARSAQKPGAVGVLDVGLEQAGGSAATATGNAARGGNLLPIPAPTYYRTDQLTKPPRATSQPNVDVPRKVARSVSGTVILKLWIDERGNVDSVEVESSNLPKTVSGIAAAAFAKLRFVPGEIDGRRVRALMRIEVVYGKRPPP